MADRKKVLTQLAELGIGLDMAGYHDDAQCVRDTLALLREQEPVKPIIENGFSYCGVCGRSLDSDFADEEVFRFCPNCGRKVRQDEAD